jgi:hypothetical protein
MASHNTLLIEGMASRARVGGGQYELPLLATIADVAESYASEFSVDPAEMGKHVSLGLGGAADALLIVTDRPIVLHLGSAGAPGVALGSLFILMDTNITDLYVDNVGSDVATFELWVVRK